jgi:RNA 2',3'-cyclic 3'-phosphodiesterase
MPRLFIGIKIESQYKLELFYYELRKKFKSSDINWVHPKNFHLTLKFLGDVKSHLINPISSLLSHISLKHKPFILNYNKPGFFGTLNNPKVLWVDFISNQELNLLQNSIDKSLTGLGFDIENKKYSPHLTLARVKRFKEENLFRDIFNIKIMSLEASNVNEFQLIQSNLKQEGPEYSILTSFKLEADNYLRSS